MLKYVVFFAFSLFIFSCSKQATEIPPSLQKLISEDTNCTCEPFIDEYRWKSETVYLYSCKGPTCNCVTWYYDIKGEQITMRSGYTPDDFKREGRLMKNVWTCQ